MLSASGMCPCVEQQQHTEMTKLCTHWVEVNHFSGPVIITSTTIGLADGHTNILMVNH